MWTTIAGIWTNHLIDSIRNISIQWSDTSGNGPFSSIAAQRRSANIFVSAHKTHRSNISITIENGTDSGNWIPPTICSPSFLSQWIWHFTGVSFGKTFTFSLSLMQTTIAINNTFEILWILPTRIIEPVGLPNETAVLAVFAVPPCCHLFTKRITDAKPHFFFLLFT